MAPSRRPCRRSTVAPGSRPRPTPARPSQRVRQDTAPWRGAPGAPRADRGRAARCAIKQLCPTSGAKRRTCPGAEAASRHRTAPACTGPATLATRSRGATRGGPPLPPEKKQSTHSRRESQPLSGRTSRDPPAGAGPGSTHRWLCWCAVCSSGPARGWPGEGVRGRCVSTGPRRRRLVYHHRVARSGRSRTHVFLRDALRRRCRSCQAPRRARRLGHLLTAPCHLTQSPARECRAWARRGGARASGAGAHTRAAAQSRRPGDWAEVTGRGLFD
jgi:hypothetical protein